MCNTTDWQQLKRTVSIGDIVHGVVASHHPFGVFVSLSGTEFRGLIQIGEFKEGGTMTVDEYPPVGNSVSAKVLGFKEFEQQIWLSMRPSAVD